MTQLSRDQLLAEIDDAIYQNTAGAITGESLNGVLVDMIDSSELIDDEGQSVFTYEPPKNINTVTQGYFNVNCISGNPTLTIGGATFTAANVGDYITISGAGPASSELRLITQILSIGASAGQITVTSAPTQTIPGFSLQVFWGTDQHLPIQTFLTQCVALNAKPYIPSGIYLVSQGLVSLPPYNSLSFANNFNGKASLITLDPGTRIVAVAPMTAVITYGSLNPNFSGYLRYADFGGGAIDGNFVANYCADVPFGQIMTRSSQLTMNSLLSGVRWGNNSAPQASSGSLDFNVVHARDCNYSIPITGISNANPCVVTTAYQHGIPTGRSVCITGSNQASANSLGFQMTATGLNTLTLNNTDSTGWGAYSGAGAALFLTMPSNDPDFQIAGIALGAATTVTLAAPHGHSIGTPWNVFISDVQGVDGFVDGLFVATPTSATAMTLALAVLTQTSPGVTTISSGAALNTSGLSAYIGNGWLVNYRDPATVEKAIWFENCSDADTDSVEVFGVRVGTYANPWSSGFDGKHRKHHIFNFPIQGTLWRAMFIGGDNVLSEMQCDLPFKFTWSFWAQRNDVIGCRANYEGAGLGAVANYSSFVRLEGGGLPLAYGSGGGQANVVGGGAKATSQFPMLSEVSVAGMTQGTSYGYTRDNFASLNVQLTQANSSLGDRGGFVNLFRNGPMDVWQRGIGPFTVTSPAYTADGWIVAAVGASVAVSQTGGRAITSYALKILGQAGVTAANINQRIASIWSDRFENQLATFQCWLYNGTGAGFYPGLFGATPTATDNWTSETADPALNTVQLQYCPPGAWTLLSYTWSPTNPYLGYAVSISLGAALNGAGNYIVVGEFDVRSTPNITRGPPTPELRPVDIEFLICRHWLYAEAGNAGVLKFTAYNEASAENIINLSIINMFDTPNASLVGTWSTVNASSPAITAVSSDLIAFSWTTTALGNSSIANPAAGGFLLSAEL